MSDRCGAVFDPHLIAVGVVAVVMGVECKPHRFVRQRPDLGQNILRTRRKVRIDHQDIIPQDDPSVVAVTFFLNVTFVKVNAIRNRIDHVDFGSSLFCS